MKQTGLFVVLVTSLLCVYVDAIIRKSGCVLQKVPGYPNRFSVHRSLLLGKNKDFWCSNGTVFDEDLCTCVTNEDPYFLATAPPVTQSPYVTEPDGSVLPPMTTVRECTFKPALDRRFYMQRRWVGKGWIRRPCPYGSLYNETLCLCADPAPISSLYCRPKLNITFNLDPNATDTSNIIDSSGQTLHIDNTRVTVVDNSGRFDRRGRLDIPFYANNYLGTKLTITFLFFDYPGGDREQVLMSNCYPHEKYGSIEIILRPSTDEVLFRIATTQTKMKEIAVPYKKTDFWNKVKMTYDGAFVRGQVNSDENSAPVKGNIIVRNKGISIGQCQARRNGSKRAYVGYIDEFKVYSCVLNGDYNI